MSDDLPLKFFIWLAVGIGLFFLMRSVYLWYFRINDIVELLEQQIYLLKKIVPHPKKEVKKTADEWKCPECEAINPNSTYTCTNCSYSLK